MNIGEKIIISRQKLGLNQKQLAEKSGLTQATISRIEKDKDGIKELRATALRKLAKALGVTVDYLVGNSAEISPPDLIRGDSRAEDLIMAYNAFNQTEREALGKFAEYLKSTGAGMVIERPFGGMETFQADGVLGEDQIFYRIVDVKREKVSDGSIPYIRYSVKAAFQKFKKGAEIEVKKRDNVTAVFIRKGDYSDAQVMEIAASDAQPDGYNVDESQILKNAIDKACAEAREKLI